jgi:hypothetical protein
MIAGVLEVVEVPANIAARLVDLLVGVRVGVLWRLVRIDNEVASRSPMEVLDAGLKPAPTLAIGALGLWAS